MRGTLNLVAASGGKIQAAASDSADVGQSASVLPIPVPLGNATVTVAGGGTPTNAVITLTQAVPGVGNSATIFDDEFSTAPWQPHRLFQAGDQWSYTTTVDTTGSGVTDDADTWWANPIATPQAATVYPPPSQGALPLGLMSTPSGIGISQAFIGTLINNQRSGGLRLFGYHEMRVKVPRVPGFLWHWDIEDYPTTPTDTAEMDLDIWTDGTNTSHVRFSFPAGLPLSPNRITIYETTTLDVTQFHIYALNWQTDHVTVYIDGLVVAQVLNPGGDYQTQACFAYFLTSAASFTGDIVPTPASLPAFAQIDYYRLFSNIPTTAGVVLVHAFNAGGSTNTISDSVGQGWIRHQDARIGSAPRLTAISHNTLPMAAGSTITVGFSNPSANTTGTAAAWYVPFVNGSSFGSLANVGATGAIPNAPSITASVSGSSAVVLVTLPTTGAPLDAGVVQVQYRVTGTTSWTSVPSPPTYCTPASGSLLDSFGNTWALASNGNPVINGTVTDTTSHAQELFLITGTLWQFDGTSWYSFTPGGTITNVSQVSWAGPNATSPLLSPGITVGGLAAGNYDLSAYVSNSAGPGALSSIAQVTIGSATTGPGPAASSAFLTADYTSPYFYPSPGTQTQNPARGQMIISPRLYSVVDGAGGNDSNFLGSFTGVQNGNPFALFTSPEYQTKMATVNPGMWRFLTLPASTWNFGTNPPTIATNAYTNLIQNFFKVDPLGVSSIIMGLNWRDLNVTSQTTYGQMIHALALFFQNQIMPNGKRLPVIGFTGQNEPSAGDPAPWNDPNGFYNQIVANCKNVTLPGGGAYIVAGPVPAAVFPDWTSWAGFTAAVAGIDIFTWDNFFEGSPTPGGVPMSRLQTPQSQGGVSDYFSDGLLRQVSPNVTYQPSLAYMPAGNMDSAVADIAMGDYRGAVWDALQHIQCANCSPVFAYNEKWDSALQGPAGFLLDTEPAVGNPITPAGYYNGRAVRTTTGPRWNVPTNAIGFFCIACNPSASDLTMKIVNAGQGSRSGTIAFSHWPINSTGNGTLNMWQMTSSSTADGNRSTITVTAGVSQTVTLPDPSITIISSIA